MTPLDPRRYRADRPQRFCSKACRGKAFSGPRTSRQIRCEHCGNEFLAYASKLKRATRHYCSRACQIAGRTGDANPNWRGGMPSCVCQNCGTTFVIYAALVAKGEGKYCSNACRHAGLRIYIDVQTARREHGRRRDTRERMARKDNRTHTLAQWEDLKRRAKGRCVKCHQKRPLTRDHIIPVSRGGSDEITNIQPLCHSCNARKHNAVETLL